MVDVAQLVRVSVCGTEGRGFEPRLPPNRKLSTKVLSFFCAKKFVEARFSKFTNAKKELQSSWTEFLIEFILTEELGFMSRANNIPRLPPKAGQAEMFAPFLCLRVSVYKVF
jgi:hypothetical protein